MTNDQMFDDLDINPELLRPSGKPPRKRMEAESIDPALVVIWIGLAILVCTIVAGVRMSSKPKYTPPPTLIGGTVNVLCVLTDSGWVVSAVDEYGYRATTTNASIDAAFSNAIDMMD